MQDTSPIDVRRAKTDLVYFAKEYFGTDLFPEQVRLIESILDIESHGKLSKIDRPYGKTTIINIAKQFKAFKERKS